MTAEDERSSCTTCASRSSGSRGARSAGSQVGDYFELTESSRLRIPEGRHFCLYALQAVLPLLPAKQRQLARRRLARAGQPRLLSRSRGAADHAHRAHRPSLARDARPDVSARERELGLGLQSDAPLGGLRPGRRRPRRPGFAIVCAVQRPLVPAAAAPGCSRSRGATSRVRIGLRLPQPVHAASGRDRGPDRRCSTQATSGRAFLGLARGCLAGRAGHRVRIAPGRARARGLGGRAPAARGRSRGLRRRALRAAAGRGAALSARTRRAAAAGRRLAAAARRVRRRAGRRAQARRVARTRRWCG